MATTKRVTITDETIRELFRLTPEGDIKRNKEAFKKLVFPYWGRDYYGSTSWLTNPVKGLWAGIGKCKVHVSVIRKVLVGTAKPFSFDTHVFLTAEAARKWRSVNKHADHKLVQTKATKEAAGPSKERGKAIVEAEIRQLFARVEAGESFTKTEVQRIFKDCY